MLSNQERDQVDMVLEALCSKGRACVGCVWGVCGGCVWGVLGRVCLYAGVERRVCVEGGGCVYGGMRERGVCVSLVWLPSNITIT